MIIKVSIIINMNFILYVNIVRGKGNSSVISTSKIKKITAIMKKFNENGIRAEFLGSNPHSNGEDLLCWKYFMVKIRGRVIRVVIIRNTMMKEIRVIIISMN